ncbi:MAG: phospho-N-acetylmuramoyl-pentapeptide-transferase, partial [Myxococcota bacterium]|nr:phospho-N-acetylmuramoyl-pentapeptide-transferase [Myxococcota bacterium]
MLYHLCMTWVDVIGPLRVFRYPSFRIPAAALTALVLMLVFFPRFIEYLRRGQHGVSNVREDTPEQHQVKTGTPTMGGLFILISLTVSTLLWADLSNIYVWAVLVVTIGFGLIGFIDDYRKVSKKNSKGLSGRFKLLFQVLILGAVTGLLYLAETGIFGDTGFQFDTTVSLPFVSIRLFNPDIGWLYVPFAFLVVMGTSNAVNLTDGLDGLAIGPTVVSAVTFMILAYVAGLALTFNVQGQWVEFNVAEYL